MYSFRRDLERQAKKAKGDDMEDGESSAVITALDLEDAWRKSSEGIDYRYVQVQWVCNLKITKLGRVRNQYQSSTTLGQDSV